jgi:hypothetical protein
MTIVPPPWLFVSIYHGKTGSDMQTGPHLQGWNVKVREGLQNQNHGAGRRSGQPRDAPEDSPYRYPITTPIADPTTENRFSRGWLRRSRFSQIAPTIRGSEANDRNGPL